MIKVINSSKEYAMQSWESEGKSTPEKRWTEEFVKGKLGISKWQGKKYDMNRTKMGGRVRR